MRLAIFGYGFTGRVVARRARARGWRVVATFRRMEARTLLDADGVAALEVTGPLDRLAPDDALWITPAPAANGCPAHAALSGALADSGRRPGWIGYLSTTGVYGDRAGGWVSERSVLAPRSEEAQRRVVAEAAWQDMGASLFRLPGIYGPGRSAFDRLRDGTARRILAPGQVFSRIHVEDLAAGLEASIARPRPGGVYNLCDDEPAPNSEVIAHAARLLGAEPPPEVPLAEAGLSAAGLRFYAESKRVSNARAKAELGWRPAHPTYREGLAAILAASG
ncbi:MAG: SDR family NAD(P)-dependent oxidoreductase [Phenylobacterium sp.]